MLLREQPISMLIVDDSEDDAFLLFSELASRGAKVDYKRVDTAPDMSAALGVGNWDLIICDHSMPGFDALTALEVLKQSGKDIPFIIYSGHISDQTAYTAMGDGVNDYIQKGNYARLIPVIERELKGAAARSAVRQADSRIMELAYFDKLSSLPNHNYFCARVTELIAECEQFGKAPCGALFYIDLDRFLRINSSFGYEAGNEILRQSAACLKERAAESGFLLRRDHRGLGFVRVRHQDEHDGHQHGDDQRVDSALRQFIYLPFMHSEQLEDQDRCVTLFSTLGNDAANNIKYAEIHRDIIRRFGRFPHRNTALGRHTTADEQVFLDRELRDPIGDAGLGRVLLVYGKVDRVAVDGAAR